MIIRFLYFAYFAAGVLVGFLTREMIQNMKDYDPPLEDISKKPEENKK